MYYMGMDVHAKVSMICVLDEGGKPVREVKVRGDLGHLVGAVAVLKNALGRLKVCYEASCGYGWLHDQLRSLGCQVQVAHPGKVRLIFRTKRKNDRIDAQKLALLLYLDQVPLAHVPPAERRQWRSLIEYRQRLVSRRGAAIQRDQLLEELQTVADQIRRVERILKTQADREPAVSLLTTIPGVGVRTAEAVAAYIDDPNRFRRNKSVGCYFGLVPCENTSVKARFGHITKEGPATVRKLLVEATWQAIRRDAHVRAYFDRVQRGDPNRKKIAVVATAHHLLRVMHAMFRTGEVWRSAAA